MRRIIKWKHIFTIICILSMCLMMLGQSKKENPPVHVACIGDSITYGYGVMENRETEGWTYILDNLLPESYFVYNYGISGTTVQKTADNPYVYHREWQEIQQNPMDVYILMLGSNDCRADNWNEKNFKADYAEMVDEILNFPWNPELIVMLPPKIFFESQDSVLTEKVHPIISEIASEKNIEVIDLYEITKDHPEYFTDGLHPGKSGNKKIAKLIYKKLYD